MLGLFHYKILCEVLEQVHLFRTREEIADFVLAKVSQALDSQGGTVFLLDENNEGYLVPMAAYGASFDLLRENRFPIGQGIVGWVAKFKEPLYVEDARKDPRFLNAVDTKTGFETRSVVAAPVLFGAKVEGVLEFLNKRNGKFSEADLELITILGRELGAAIEKAVLQENRRTADTLGRLVTNLSAGVVIADPYHNVTITNSRAKEILNTESFALAEGDPLDKLGCEWPELAYTAKKVMETTLPIYRQQTSVYPKRIVGYSCVPLTDHEGTVAGAALLLQDITPFLSVNTN